MLSVFKKFWSEDAGQGLTEYALILALVSIGLIAILVLFRNAIGDVFNNIKNVLDAAPGQQYSA